VFRDRRKQSCNRGVVAGNDYDGRSIKDIELPIIFGKMSYESEVDGDNHLGERLSSSVEGIITQKLMIPKNELEAEKLTATTDFLASDVASCWAIFITARGPPQSRPSLLGSTCRQDLPDRQ
jgi:hypothetical protein